MINIEDDPKEIIKELSETEKNILYILGKMQCRQVKIFSWCFPLFFLIFLRYHIFLKSGFVSYGEFWFI